MFEGREGQGVRSTDPDRRELVEDPLLRTLVPHHRDVRKKQVNGLLRKYVSNKIALRGRGVLRRKRVSI